MTDNKTVLQGSQIFNQEGIIELRIGMARLEERVESIDDKFDNMHSDVKDIKKSLSDDVKTSNKWMRSAIFKLMAILIAGGIGGTTANAVVKAMVTVEEAPAPITQTLDIIKDYKNDK